MLMRPATSRGAILRSSGGSSGLSSSGDSLEKSFKEQRNAMTNAGSRSIMTAAPGSRSVMTARRPMTGAGGLAKKTLVNKPATNESTPAVASAGYYSNLLQKKSEEIVKEIARLERETELNDANSESRRKLELEHKNAAEEMKQLEEALASMNIAAEKSRSGASDEDIREETNEIAIRNKALEHEIDEYFVSRKRVESQTIKLEAELKQMSDDIKEQFSDDPEMTFRYQMFVGIMDDLNAEERDMKAKINDVDEQIKFMEAEGGHARCKQAKERISDLELQIAQINNDLELIEMDEHDARKFLLDKVKRIDKQQKKLEMRSDELQSEIDSLIDEQCQLRAQSRLKSYRPSEGSAAIELFLATTEKQKNFLANVPQVKAWIEEEHKQHTLSIEILKQDLEKLKASADMELPSKEELQLMEEEVAFTTKHVDANWQTTCRLRQQKKVRELELEKIITLEDRINAELQDIESKTYSMTQEMTTFKSPQQIQASADERRDRLIELTEECALKIEELERQWMEASSKHMHLEKILESVPNWKSIEHIIAKIKNQEEEIGALQKELDAAKAESGHLDMKSDCLALLDNIVAKQ